MSMREHAGSPRRLDLVLREALAGMQRRTAALDPLLARMEASRDRYERRAIEVQVSCELEAVDRSRKAITRAQAALHRRRP
jgi:hypothetical protein